ncbi:MAG: hypothetical protein ACI8ZB_004391 [Desulforhopalus sp.]|jgi:hypothetical protein
MRNVKMGMSAGDALKIIFLFFYENIFHEGIYSVYRLGL